MMTSSPEINMASYIAFTGKVKKKRKRTIISKRDLEKLEELFEQDKWPDRNKKMTLAQAISKSENFISTWFQNRRAKLRRLSRQDLSEQFDLLKVDTKNSNGRATNSMKLTFHDVKFSNQKRRKSHGERPADKGRENKMPPGLEDIKENLNFMEKHPGEFSVHDERLENGDTRYRHHNRRRSRKYDNIDNSNSTELLERSGQEDAPVKRVNWELVFRHTVEMAAASEGALASSHPSLTQAVRHAALGINLKDAKLVYSREYGLDFVDLRRSR